MEAVRASKDDANLSDDPLAGPATKGPRVAHVRHGRRTHQLGQHPIGYARQRQIRHHFTCLERCAVRQCRLTRRGKFAERDSHHD